MRKIKENRKSIMVALLLLCLICTVILAALFASGNKEQVYAFALSEQESIFNNQNEDSYWQGFRVDNLMPFREFAESRGFVFDDDSTLDMFVESFDCLYYEAVELGVIVPIEDCILSQHSYQKIQPFWGSAGDSTSVDGNGSHSILARLAYSFVQPLFPSVFDPLSPLNFDSENPNPGYNLITRYINQPDLESGLNITHFHHAVNGRNMIGGSRTAVTEFLVHYNFALTHWILGNRDEAYRSLGRALHFIQDLTTPHHVGDQIPYWMWVLPLFILAPYVAVMINEHVQFEIEACAQLRNYIVPNMASNGYWNNFRRDYSNLPLDTLLNNIISRSFSYYPFWKGAAQNRISVARATLPNAVDATISVLKRFAMDVGGGGFGVTQNPTGYTIRGIGSHSGNLIIPETIHTRPITQIAASAFLHSSRLLEITLPASVTYIGSSAFSHVTTVNWEGNFRFRRLSYGFIILRSLSESSHIVVPDTIAYSPVLAIGDGAFFDTNVASVVLPATIRSIGINAFAQTPLFQNSSTDIVYAGNWAVGMRATSSTNASLIEGTIGIADRAFAGLTNRLTNISLPNTLRYIGLEAFAGSRLEEVELPNSLLQIHTGAFRDSTYLQRVVIRREAGTNWQDLTRLVGEEHFRNTHTELTIFVPNCSFTAYFFAWSGLRVRAYLLPLGLDTKAKVYYNGEYLYA